VDDTRSLAAPWYPLVVGDGGSWRHHVPHRVRVDATEDVDLAVGDRVLEPGRTRRLRGAFAPVVAAPELHVRERSVLGVPLRWISPWEPYDPPPASARGPGALHDVVRVDAVSLAADAFADVVRTIREAEVPVRPQAVTIVGVPSRTELVATAPGVVLASDRLYEVFPIEQTREFHHRAVRRAVFRHLVEPMVRRVEPVADRPWSDDLRAVLLTDVDDARKHGEARTPEDLIGFAAFHPAVDQLLYAPQVAFVDVYFGAIAEPDPFREDPARARRPRARGRRILESARDALDEDAFRGFTRALLRGRVSAREALREASPELASRMNQWLAAPTLEVNYRLGEVRSERGEEGGWVHRVEVIRDGDERIEPVEIEVEDDAGNVVTEEWDGRGSRGVVEVETPAELDGVRLDPDGRLPQSPRLTGGHPRGDDASSHPFKPPLLRGFGLNVNLSEERVEGFVDFAMRRVYDLENTIGATLDHDAAATGLTLRYARGFGPKRHNNSRIAAASVSLGVDRLRDDFIEGQDGGYRLSLSLGAGYDTRTYFVDPRSGTSLSGSGGLGVTRRDDGSVGITGRVGARGSATAPIGLLNVLSVVAGGGWTFGDALPGEHQGLGGRFLLRAFESGELVGDGRAYVVAEHRFTAFRDLAWNAVHVAWLREIQLAVFGGAGALFESLDGRDVVLAAEAGVGVRFLYEYAGVQPAVLSVDVAFPLTRDPNRAGSDGLLGSERPAVGVHVAFDQFL